MDTLASLISGLTNVFKDVLGLTVIIVSYDWMVDNLSIIEIETTWLIYLIAFIDWIFLLLGSQNIIESIIFGIII